MVYPVAKIIWVDAHLDAHTPSTTESGNMHGMPVGILMGNNKIIQKEVLNINDVCYFGIRSYE
jgi:arginase